jgi:hypothetical protein
MPIEMALANGLISRLKGTSEPMASYLLEAARRFHAAGFSLIPCKYKTPNLKGWQQYQINRPTLTEINQWFDPEFNRGDLSIGVLLGHVSGNVVVIDLDGIESMHMFKAYFPDLTDTRIVASGSGKGAHLYFRVTHLPVNVNVRTANGGFEIRGNGQYVIAPPSPHESGKYYMLYRDLPIKQLENLNDVSEWFNSMRQIQERWMLGESALSSNMVKVESKPNKQKILSLILNDTLAQVSMATAGSRNMSLFQASLRLANYAAGGEFVWSNCESLLLQAASHVGTPEAEARRTIASAWRIGSQHPKRVK